MSKAYKLPRNDDGRVWYTRKFAALEPYNGPDAKRGQYILTEEFAASWRHDGELYRLRVPKGLITDIASIPRWTWSVGGLTPDGLYRNAALLHDILYMWQGSFPPHWFQVQDQYGNWVTCHKTWSRDQADRFFLRLMKASGVDKATRNKMYWAVKLFGWWAWRGKDTYAQEKYRYSFAIDVKNTTSPAIELQPLTKDLE